MGEPLTGGGRDDHVGQTVEVSAEGSHIHRRPGQVHAAGGPEEGITIANVAMQEHKVVERGHPLRIGIRHLEATTTPSPGPGAPLNPEDPR